MSKFFPIIVLMLFVGWVVLVSAKTASAQTNFGAGPGCSAIEGVDEATLVNGDFFTGKISCNGVTGMNPNGRPADTTDDGDPYLDSLEACINDALVGYCSTILGDESGAYTLSNINPVGQGNQCYFTATFSDTSFCMTSQCSDHVDNEAVPDGFIDFPDDPECADYDDNDESA